MTDLLDDVLSLGYIGVFIFSLVLNLVPFLSPSNMVISGAVGGIIPSFNPLLIGFLVALGASIAKTVHFVISFFVGRFLDGGQRAFKSKYHQWGMIATFIAAISPVPDDPIVVPLGLMRYNPIKFFAAYFFGKIIVTLIGAYLGQTTSLTLEKHIGQTATIIVSLILTASISLILIKKKYFLEKLKRYKIFRHIPDKL